ncbi:unnamed protein product [Gadus morhua 'NCC']
MAIAGYEKNTEQCRQKCKKLRAEYPKVNDHNNRRGVDRKMWKWFNIMDATQSTDTDRRVEEERGPSTRPPLCSSPCWSLPKSKDCLGQKKITSFYCQEPKRDGGSEIGSIEGAIEGAIVGEGSRALLEDSTAPSESVFGESVTIDSQMTGEDEGN